MDIYKTHILNNKGDISHILVFCGGSINESHLPEIFSDTQIAYYSAIDAKIHFSGQWIHKDDSVRTIKKKIYLELQNIPALSDRTYCLDEIYLFGSSVKSIDMEAIYQEATAKDTIPLTKDRFFQYALNLNFDPSILQESAGHHGRVDALTDRIFTYNDWNKLNTSPSHVQDIFTPIGMQFQNHYDFLFSANPFHTQIWTAPFRFEMSPKNPLLPMENTLLLDYLSNSRDTGINTDIMVCLAQTVFEYAAETDISQEYICALYYPQLYKRNLWDQGRLNDQVTALKKETAEKVGPKTLKHYGIVDIFHKIYWNRKTELPYVSRGIKKFSVILRSNDFQNSIPLDILFKNIHATKKAAFIKYNPGNRRENMYRLYANRIAANGKKIPLLSESKIMTLARDIGKRNQISLYVKSEKTGDDLYLNINANSRVQITGELNNLLDMGALETLLIESVNPILTLLNGHLSSAGYILPTIASLSGVEIESVNFQYEAFIKIKKKIDLTAQSSYISNVFDVISTKIDSGDGAKLRFKRVSNFKEMDAQNALITEVYEYSGGHPAYVIDSLVQNYGMTREAAVQRFSQYMSEHKMMSGGKILDNPGFSVELKILSLKPELKIAVTEIDSVEYIDVLHVYLDTILRMSQDPKSSEITAEELKLFKTKGIEAEKSDVENVVVINPDEGVDEIQLQQPLRFEKDDEIVESSPQKEGFAFDEEDYDYDYENDGENDDENNGENGDKFMVGGAGTPEEKEEDFERNIDGMSITNPTPFVKKMLERDPALFLTEADGQYDVYSRVCPVVDKRQPVILTDEEKRHIDEKAPGLYNHALHYGSDPKNKFWYICPRYWCLKTDMPISEEDVKAGKCGKIIPNHAKEIPPGAYVYEFTSKKHLDNGKYITHTPGFVDIKNHPNRLGIPCCFKKAWDSKQQVDRRKAANYDASIVEGKEEDEGKEPPQQEEEIAKITSKNTSYVMNPSHYPLPTSRWGFLPISMQLFLQLNNAEVIDPQNMALIRPNEPVLLRYGMENSEKQSFLGCVAYFYAYKQNLTVVPTIEEMRGILAKTIDLDLFLQYQNGNLATIFRPKTVDSGSINLDRYSKSRFYRTIDLEDESQVDYLEDTIAAYENFIEFLRDENSEIDHTYLWDMMCSRNDKLMRDGMNLVILKVADNDVTEKVQMISPSNAYSSATYDPSKETAILLKQGDFYEPIHLYELLEVITEKGSDEPVYKLKRGEQVNAAKDKVIHTASKKTAHVIKSGHRLKQTTIFKKAFLELTAVKPVKDLLLLVQQVSKKYWQPLASQPKVYKFKRNLPAIEVMRTLKTHRYNVLSQVLNYRNKVIGLQINHEDDQDALFVPCYPSNMMEGLRTVYMDDAGLWLDYRLTRDRLKGVSMETRGKVLSKPVVKIVDDGMVVGFLTETNQFVQIDPPLPEDGVDDDGIETIRHSSYQEGSIDSTGLGQAATIGKTLSSTLGLVTAPESGNRTASADKTLALKKSGDQDRIEVVRRIRLETQFYTVFRSLIRILVNDFDNRGLKEEIVSTISDVAMLRKNKLKKIERILRRLARKSATFQEFDPEILASMDEIALCSSSNPSKPKYCLTSDDGINVKTIFPKAHLLSGQDNEIAYFWRVTDELLRYRRIQLFMLQPKVYLNIPTSSMEYQIADDELFLLESLLTREYFKDLVPYNVNRHIQNIEYDTATPLIAQTYINDVTLDEQRKLREAATTNAEIVKGQISDYITDCIRETRSRVIGNEKAGSWKRYFPALFKEIIFDNTVVCSFIPMIYVLQEVFKKTGLSVQNVKTALWTGYSKLLGGEGYDSKILSILRKQGKRDLTDLVKTGRATLERVIFSDAYYITDLDWWVLCHSTGLPVVLFSSTSLKNTLKPVEWLRLSAGKTGAKYFFVRSPSAVTVNQPPAYHVLNQAISFADLEATTMFLDAERGSSEYQSNIQGLDDFLAKFHLITKK
jgi:hypothetical protein